MLNKRFWLFLILLAAFLAGFFIFQKPKEEAKQVKTETKGEQKEEPKPEPASNLSTSLRVNILVAVGDVMLSRHVGEKIDRAGDPKLPFLKTVSILKNADITFANLESPFYDKGPKIREGMIFKAEPEYIEGLKYATFNILSLANNHFGDKGKAGMDFTFNLLKENGIEYAGAGENEEEAYKPKILERKGIKFAFLAYADATSQIPVSYKATEDKAGIAWFSKERLRNDIQKAKEKADVIILSFHWGIEYQTVPSTYQKEIAHFAIDQGASVILGHHPHVIQPYEKYKEGYIFYSLGNFVFDQMWSEKTRKGEIAKIYFKDKEIEKVETIPITIYDFYQPRVDNPRVSYLSNPRG